jgi:hypothetical protein
MRSLVAIAALATVLAAGGGGGTTPRLQSWSDRQHRWVVGDTSTGPRAPGAVRCGAQVCESNDGGRHWRKRFSCCEDIVDLVRTSARAGVVAGNSKEVAVWWTVGGGKWFPTDRIAGDFEGRGESLFWHRFGTTLYEVRPWPPTGPIPCVHPTKTWPRICDPQESVFEADPVAIIPDGEFAGLANVPGGVVAPIAGSPPRVLVRRDDDTRLATLSTDAEICGGTEPVRVQVRWPRLFVPACGGVGRRGWRSVDGGKTWEFVAK